MMNTTPTPVVLLLGALLLGLGDAARGVLIDVGNGLINDTTRNLVWTKDANLAATRTFGVTGINGDGTMSWDKAQAWVLAMNTTGYKGYNDWRLWQVTDIGNDGCNFAFSGTDCGYNIDTATGELAGLWYDTLDNLSYFDTSGYGPQSGWGLTHTGPFTNMQSPLYSYWSGTQDAAKSDFGWYFQTDRGSQDVADKDSQYYTWAVRAGQAVPLPATGLLVALGLIVLGVSRRGPRATQALASFVSMAVA